MVRMSGTVGGPTELFSPPPHTAASSGAIVGVFLGDERMYFGLKLAEVKLIADEVRGDFHAAIIYLNEGDVTSS